MKNKKRVLRLIIAVLAAIGIVAVCLIIEPFGDYRPKYSDFCHTNDDGIIKSQEVDIPFGKAERIARIFRNADWKFIDDLYPAADPLLVPPWSGIIFVMTPELFVARFHPYDYVFTFRNQTVRYNSSTGACMDTVRICSAELSSEDRLEINRILNTPDPISLFPELSECHIPDPERISLTVIQNTFYSDVSDGLVIRWQNLGEKPFSLGQSYRFCLYENGWKTVSERIVAPEKSLIALEKGASADLEYFLSDSITPRLGEVYRLYLDIENTDDCWLEFVYGGGYEDASWGPESNLPYPPQMTAGSGTSEITAEIGTFNWFYKDYLGRSHGTENDGWDFYLLTPRLNTLMASGEGPVTLSFGPLKPESITVSYWDTDWKDVKTVNGTSFEPVQGSRTYRIIARFGCGTVYYGFNVNRPE